MNNDGIVGCDLRSIVAAVARSRRWPFRKRKDDAGVGHATSLSACISSRGPVRVRCEVSITPENETASALTGARGVAFVVEVLERMTHDELSEDGRAVPDEVTRYHPVRTVQLGGPLVLRGDDGVEVTVSPAQVGFVFATLSPTVIPLVNPVAELGAFAASHRSRYFREQVVRPGDRFHLAATVESTATVGSWGYRSGASTAIVVRPDLSPLVLEEILITPSW
jgi:hypothetical protein